MGEDIMNDLVLIDASNPLITTLTLNRPEKRNALCINLIQQLTAAITETPRDPMRRVIILRGSGQSFCAGLDLHEAADPAQAHNSAVGLFNLYRALAGSPLITIASVHGAAMGGGAGLVAACDFVIAATDLKLAYPEVHRGLVAALVSTLLKRQLPDRIVRELILLGQTLDVTRALELGLINHIGTFDDAMSLAHQACKGAPGAIARSKRLLDELSPRSLEQDLKTALDFHLTARHSSEAAEGMAAFLEKRSPQWGPREM